MLAYALTGCGSLGIALAYWAGKHSELGSFRAKLFHNLLCFFLPLTIAGSLFSALQVWLQATDNYEETSRTIRELEHHLAQLHSISRFIKPSTWLEVASYVILIVLTGLIFVRSSRLYMRILARYTSFATQLYVWSTLFVSLTFFGSLTAGSVLAQKIAETNQHIDSIVARYSDLIGGAIEPFLAQPLPSIAQTEPPPAQFEDHRDDCQNGQQDDSWPCLVDVWLKLGRSLDDIQSRYPDFFDPPDGKPPPSIPGAPSGFPPPRPEWKARRSNRVYPTGDPSEPSFRFGTD
jgi:hypothetical protein